MPVVGPWRETIYLGAKIIEETDWADMKPIRRRRYKGKRPSRWVTFKP